MHEMALGDLGGANAIKVAVKWGLPGRDSKAGTEVLSELRARPLDTEPSPLSMTGIALWR